MKRNALRIALALLLSTGACSRAELPGDTDGRHAWSPAPTATPDPVGSRLFPPELVMSHQAAIGLEKAQRDAIQREVTQAQAGMNQLEWDMNAEKEKLVEVLSAEHVDEARALDAAVRVMAVEDKVKAAHLGLLVRIKNQLTPAQQSKLAGFRAGSR